MTLAYRSQAHGSTAKCGRGLGWIGEGLAALLGVYMAQCITSKNQHFHTISSNCCEIGLDDRNILLLDSLINRIINLNDRLE